MNTLQNALPIDKPENYSCQLYSYVRGHRQLWIEVNSLSKSFYDHFYLHFPAVVYFSGATGWLGADFVIESPETCLDFLRSSGLYEQFDGISEDELGKFHRLYSVRGSQTEVKILTLGDVYRTDEAPSWILSDSENKT